MEISKNGRYIDAVLDDFCQRFGQVCDMKDISLHWHVKASAIVTRDSLRIFIYKCLVFWKHVDQLFPMEKPTFATQSLLNAPGKKPTFLHTLDTRPSSPCPLPENLCTLQTELLRHISTELVIAFKECRRKAETCQDVPERVGWWTDPMGELGSMGFFNYLESQGKPYF